MPEQRKTADSNDTMTGTHEWTHCCEKFNDFDFSVEEHGPDDANVGYMLATVSHSLKRRLSNITNRYSRPDNAEHVPDAPRQKDR